MKTPLKLILAILPAALSLPITTFAAPVDSMSLEVFKDGPQRFWEVSVVCEGQIHPRLMLRPVDKDQWCSSEIGSLCDENKFSLSRQLCSDNFNQQLVNHKEGRPVLTVKADPIDINPDIGDNVDTKQLEPLATTPTTNSPVNAGTPPSTSTIAPIQVVSKENLLKEQMQIEEQRILIEQKRLELRRKQLELQKRQ
jgi:hypothetical protein